MSKLIAVKDMPFGVKDACVERGIALDHKMTPEDAIAEYTAWHLGDGGWGSTIYRHIKDMEKVIN